jgi:hypothetical protein
MSFSGLSPSRLPWRQAYHPIVVIGLTVSGLSLGWVPALANGTAAGTDIINRATTTYRDGPDDGTSTLYEGVSNTVTVTVSKVAGIEVADNGFTNTTGNPAEVVNGDILEFDFLVTNVGNDDTYVFIPGANNIAVTGGVIQAVEVVARNGDALPDAVAVPTGGESTETLTDLGLLAAGDSYRVRIRVRVQATTPGQTVRVQFGNTADNTIAPDDGSQNAQNIADATDGGPLPNDVRTLATGDAPVNGEREAAAAQATNVGQGSLAQVRLLLTGSQADGGNPTSASDNQLTYSYTFNVGNTVIGSFDPGPLAGTSLTVDSATVDRILIANAIPDLTVWDGTPPTVPANWQVVYSTNDPSLTGDNPLEVNWSTTPPAADQVKRIGFIYDATTHGAIAPGTDVSGFQFTVITSGLDPTGGNVANIGQIFGITEGDSDRKLVYDESGDQAFNNYPGDTPPADPEAETFDPENDLGIADPNNPDPGNNAGTGPGGASLVIAVTATSSSIYHGPEGQPQAVGPTNSHDDFANKAATLPPGQVGAPGDPANPDPVTFTNSLYNPHGGALSNIHLRPLAPSEATAAVPNGTFGTNGGIPTGTTVTVTYGAQSAVYTFDGTTFNRTSGAAIVVDSLGGGTSLTYQTTINLPDGTPQVEGYGIPMVAFADTGDGSFNPNDDPIFNLTVNRVYPQFVRLVKEVQIYDSTGTARLGDFTSSPGAVELRPGDRIAYRVSYTNISTAEGSGTGNLTLTAHGLRIDEDGLTGGNTWGNSTTHFLGTTATQGTVEFFNGGTSLGVVDAASLVSGDPATGTAVSRYLNLIDTLAPGQSGSLLFQRTLN